MDQRTADRLSKAPQPSLGIDIDGCIDEAPVFFQILTHRWPGDVFVVSFRKERAPAEAVLAKFNIRYDELILVDSLDAKADVISKRGIAIFFDDQPECLKDIDSMRNVFLIRNGGNFDHEDKKWMFSDQTGKKV
jgi:uncharacterized HAD superfamily protein